jgi:hypothetical protein
LDTCVSKKFPLEVVRADDALYRLPKRFRLSQLQIALAAAPEIRATLPKITYGSIVFDFSLYCLGKFFDGSQNSSLTRTAPNRAMTVREWSPGIRSDE